MVKVMKNVALALALHKTYINNEEGAKATTLKTHAMT